MRAVRLLRLALFSFIVSPLAAYAGDTPPSMPAGVVFPAFGDTVAADAAALPYSHASQIDLEFAPPILGASTTFYGANVHHATGTWGVGAGYSGSKLGGAGGGLTHEIEAGGAVKISSVSLGLALSSPFVTQTFSPSYEVSGQVALGSWLQFAAVLHGLPTSLRSLELGLGHREAGKFAVEGGVEMPFLTHLFDNGATYIAYVAGNVTFNSFTVGAGVHTLLSDISPTFGFGGTWSISRKYGVRVLWNKPAFGTGSLDGSDKLTGAFWIEL